MTPLAVGLPVRRLEPSENDLLFDALHEAGTPFLPERRAAKRRFYATPEFQTFVVTDPHGAPMGWSTAFVGEGFASLGDSCTRPALRGLAEVLTDVEHGSQSHAKCERAGLRPVTISPLWAR